jgi:alpha/beta superfamily hydrolase
MKAPEEKILVAGPAGNIEVIMERPDAPRGIALIAHPHPLGGGANTNKVAYTLARTFVSLGYAAFRPNFRGVGGTEGVHDEGRGETDDLLAVIEDASAAAATCRSRWPASRSAPTARRASPNG